MYHMSTIPVLEEEHFSAKGGDSIQDHGWVTGIRGSWLRRFRLKRLVRVLTYGFNQIRIQYNKLWHYQKLDCLCKQVMIIHAICQWVLTIERLDAIDIILGQNEGVRVGVWVHRVHESTRVIGVRQAQGVAKLMGSHEEEDVLQRT